MTIQTIIPIYTVDIDTETGAWLGEAVDTGETTTLADWATKQDTDTQHFDTYEHTVDRHEGITETRAIVCTFK